MEVPERELSDEFNQCWFNDAMDELDPKKFSVLHERDAQTVGSIRELYVSMKMSHLSCHISRIIVI